MPDGRILLRAPDARIQALSPPHAAGEELGFLPPLPTPDIDPTLDPALRPDALGEADLALPWRRPEGPKGLGRSSNFSPKRRQGR